MPIYRNLAGRNQGKAADYVTADAAWVDGVHTTIGYFRMAAHGHSNPHYHHDEQFLYLLKGGLRIAVEGEILEAAPGDLVQFRPGEVHEIMALDEPVELLLTRSPARPGLEVLAVTPEGARARSLLRPE
ncbi:MAG: cupin domain-containing protein [Nitrospinae bacterium]|nr:cupin domain-containing protein [Nitrospinota bacterium]